MYKNLLLIIENIKLNVKYTQFIIAMQNVTHVQKVFITIMTFMNVVNSKEAHCSTGYWTFLYLLYNINAYQTIKQIFFPD